MVHAQALSEKLVLRRDHVAVVVLGKVRVQAVARLARFSVANVVGQDDEVTRGIEKLSGTEEDVSKLRGEELMSCPAGAVENEDDVGDFAARIFCRFAEGRVVQAELGERLAGLEMEVVGDVVAFGGSGLRRSWRLGGAQSGVYETERDDEFYKTVFHRRNSLDQNETKSLVLSVVHRFAPVRWMAEGDGSLMS